MKKLVLTVFAATALVSAFAQTTTTTTTTAAPSTMTRSGRIIMKPKAGDFGLSVDAGPFLTYMGGLFSDAGAKSPLFTTNDPLRLTGRYFIADNRAIAVALDMGFSNSSITDSSGAKQTTTSNLFGIGVGYEFKRGYGRLIATYGPTARIAFASGTNTERTGSRNAAENYKEQGGGSFSLGIGGVIGVEYFIASHISLSGRVGINLAFSSTNSKDRISNGTTKNLGGENTSFNFGNSTYSGIGFNFYF